MSEMVIFRDERKEGQRGGSQSIAVDGGAWRSDRSVMFVTESGVTGR